MESINKLGIKSDAKVIIAPETSQNGGLLFLNKKGWTIETYEAIQQEKINELKDKGAEYLFLIHDEEYEFEFGFQNSKIIFQNSELTVYELSNP